MSEKQHLLAAQQDEQDQDDDTGADDDEQQDTARQAMDRQQAETQQIIETGAITTTRGKHIIHCLTIVGQVEGHYILPPQNKTTKYEHVIPQLVAIQESADIEGLIIILNTVGGDVEAGLAIAELVSGMKKPTVSLVLGGGHSIGVPLAVSARQSFIVPSATMTIHPVRMNGVVLGVPQTLSYFDKMQERIVRFVEENSRISGEKFRELMMNTGELVMDVGTVLDGQQAVEVGLIDHLGSLSDAMDCLSEMIEAQHKEKEKEAGEPKQEEKSASKAVPVLRSPRAIAQQRLNRGRGARRAAVAGPDEPDMADAPGTHTAAACRHISNRAVWKSGTAPDSGSSCKGGGERNRVNPFGHPAPPAGSAGESAAANHAAGRP